MTIAATRDVHFHRRAGSTMQSGASPQWLRAKIESVGIRSINNIVVFLEFVMLARPTNAR
jgi:phenylalanyl-tRNA synthetase beta subunit